MPCAEVGASRLDYWFAWIRIGLAPWIRIRIEIKKNWIRIRIKTNADPQHCFMLCSHGPDLYFFLLFFIAGAASQELVVQIVMIAESTRLQVLWSHPTRFL